MTIVEATGGSTGSLLAFLCVTKGYKFTVVSSDAFAEEKLKTKSAFGATVDIIHSPTGKITPDSIPFITKSHGGLHSVEGIGIGFLPPLLDKHLYDDALAIEEAEARAMSRRLAKEEGNLAGTSPGLNVVAALKLLKQLGPGKIVVTVACDTGLKYVLGDLYTEP